MKVFAFAFAVLLAGVAAVPDAMTRTNERFIEGTIRDLIEGLSNDMKERGLDPFNYEGFGFNFKLPVTDLVRAEAAIENVLVEGLSNIKINKVSYGLLTSRLQLDISLPLIFGEVGSSHAYVKILGSELSAKLSGSLGIEELRVKADVRVYVGIISGISLRSVDMDFSLGAIQSNLEIVVFGRDLSAPINEFLGETIPNSLEEHKNEINSLLEHIVKLIAERIL